MKIEINGNTFASTDACDCPPKHLDAAATTFLKKNLCLVFGIIALFISVMLLPMGFLMNVSIDVLNALLAENLFHYITVYVSLLSIVGVISIICAVISIVFFAKSKKATSDIVGLLLAILSFVLCAVALVLLILSLLVW